MSLTVDIQRAHTTGFTPADKEITRWVQACLNESEDIEVSIRIVDDAEMIELNTVYRQKAKTTNVLSFPADFPDELNIPLIGDIVICAAVVAEEARNQNKDIYAHWAHMTIHGMLHLLGYDHIEESEAAEMETLETSIMQALHYPPPYDAEDT